jgi:2'-5' RNA ligase
MDAAPIPQQPAPPATGHTGVMVAFYLPPLAASQLARPGGELPEELHLTLAYLGDTSDLDPSARILIDKILADFASYQSPIGGEVSGIGLFNTPEGGETNAFYASFDSPRLAKFRAAIVDQLRWADVEVVSNHGFTPHITLAYIPKGKPLPAVELPALPVVFESVWLSWGDERTEYPLLGRTVKAVALYRTMRTLKAADRSKVRKVMGEWKRGSLHSGSKKGPKVTDRRQAIAIALNQANKCAATYKANYGAHVGEAIQGNLGRGAGGKFAKVGDSQVASAEQRGAKIIAAGQPKGKPYKMLPPEKPKGGGKGKGGKKGGGKGGAAKKTPEEKKAELAAKQTENLTNNITALLGPDFAELFTVGDGPFDIAGAKPEYGDKLVEFGLAVKHDDGTYDLNGNGRAFIRAAQRDDPNGAKTILGAAQRQAADARNSQAKRDQVAADKKNAADQKKADQEKKRQEAAQKKLEAQKKPKGGGGGKGTVAKPVKPAKPTADQKVLDQRQKRDDTLAKVLDPELVDAVAAFADDPAAQLDPALSKKLVDQGILQQDSTGGLRMGGTAHMLLAAATRGDERAARDALSRAQDQATRRAEIKRKRLEAEAKKKSKTTKETGEPGNLTVFKDATGRYRWLSISSSAFRDQDGEIVSLKALTEDVDRADREGQYGPLRLWHTPGYDIGDCDFNAMHGRLLVESGTFKNEAFGVALARSEKELGVSIGFGHPQDQPDREGVYHVARRFERSVLPREMASNLFTVFKTQGVKPVMDEKKKGFLAKLFGGDPAAEKALDSVLSQGAETEKEAEKKGITFKAAVPPPDGTMDDQEDMTDMGADETTETPPADEQAYVAEMTVSDLHSQLDALIADTVKRALQPIMDTLTSAAGTADTTTKEVGGLAVALKEVKDLITGQNSKIASLEKTVEKQAGQIAELNGDLPKSLQSRRASQSAETVLPEDSKLKENQPAGDPLNGFLNWASQVALNGPPGQQ